MSQAVVILAGVSLLLLLHVQSSGGKVKATSKDHNGQCWRTIDWCLFRSAAGTGTPWDYCWQRCLCTGYPSHICVKSETCKNTPFPFECLCGGRSNSKIPRFCNLHKKDYKYRPKDIKWLDLFKSMFGNPLA